MIVMETISIHKALAGLDIVRLFLYDRGFIISIHKALAGLDPTPSPISLVVGISIHKALAGLDPVRPGFRRPPPDFNPQGPRGPRRHDSAASS